MSKSRKSLAEKTRNQVLVRQSVEPLYRQLAAEILRQIESGELSPGAQLPSERELIERHRVSRITVRQAAAMLQSQGHLVARRGKGTYVAEKVMTHELNGPKGFYEALRTDGVRPQTELLEFAPGAGAEDDENANRDELPVRLQRLYKLDGQPFAYVIAYLPKAAGDLGKARAADMLVYRILTEHLRLRVARADMRIHCRRPPKSVVKLLKLKSTDFALVAERSSFGSDGALYESTRTFIVPDRYEYRLQLFNGAEITSALSPRRGPANAPDLDREASAQQSHSFNLS